MAQVYLGIGSNIDKHIHIPQVLSELSAEFAQFIASPIYVTPAVGFEGEEFHNLAVGFVTNWSPQEIFQFLRDLEAKHGRERLSRNQFVARTLDLDQLLYDDLCLDDGQVSVPHQDILDYAFVLKPLADIAGERLHPILQQSYQDLWDNFDKRGLAMTPLVTEA